MHISLAIVFYVVVMSCVQIICCILDIILLHCAVRYHSFVYSREELFSVSAVVYEYAVKWLQHFTFYLLAYLFGALHLISTDSCICIYMFSERLESCRETQLPEHVGAKAACVFLAVQFSCISSLLSVMHCRPDARRYCLLLALSDDDMYMNVKSICRPDVMSDWCRSCWLFECWSMHLVIYCL